MYFMYLFSGELSLVKRSRKKMTTAQVCLIFSCSSLDVTMEGLIELFSVFVQVLAVYGLVFMIILPVVVVSTGNQRGMVGCNLFLQWILEEALQFGDNAVGIICFGLLVPAAFNLWFWSLSTIGTSCFSLPVGMLLFDILRLAWYVCQMWRGSLDIQDHSSELVCVQYNKINIK